MRPRLDQLEALLWISKLGSFRSAARKLRLKPRRRAKTFSLGSGGRTFKQAGSGRVRVKLSRKVARALRRARSLRVTLSKGALKIGRRLARKRHPGALGCAWR